MSGVGIHWFRKALRLHDNAALLKVAECSSLIPLYILDTEELDPKKFGANRLGFLLDSLMNLDEDLRNKGSRLFVTKGRPLDIMETFIKEFQVKHLTFERDTEPYNKAIDDQLTRNAAMHQVDVQSFWGHTLFDPDYLLELNNGKTPMTMNEFMRIISLAGDPPKPLGVPKQLPPPPPEMSLGKMGLGIFDTVPTLSDLKEHGYNPEEKTTWFVGGEKEGMKRMENFLDQKHRVTTFEKPKTNPTSLLPDTTACSPYMTRGSLSARLFHSRLKEITCDESSSTKPPVSLEGQLYWRELSYLIGYTSPNFHQMVDNPICMQIPWRDGEDAQALLEKWEMGQTGYPAVDATMNQLRTDGWIHHLSRHLVSCFLTRGDLWVHWEMGRDVFLKYQLDADYSIINFQWHWLSCSAFFRQYFRCYGPTTFYKKFDSNGEYIRKHLPLLYQFPDQYIYEPWEAPRNVQEASGCVVGKNYPKPMVDHKIASKDNMLKMKIAYEKAEGEAKAKRMVESVITKLQTLESTTTKTITEPTKTTQVKTDLKVE